jgi:SRSO17 transposase
MPIGDRIPDHMQRLLYRVPWNADAARDRLQRFAIETFGDDEGIGVADEMSFLKKGTHSAGGARQYLGAAGRLENGQVATVLSYAAKGAHVFLDRRLYLPDEWVWNRQRQARVRVPQKVRFETRPEQAMAMLVHAWKRLAVIQGEKSPCHLGFPPSSHAQPLNRQRDILLEIGM